MPELKQIRVRITVDKSTYDYIDSISLKECISFNKAIIRIVQNSKQLEMLEKSLKL